MIVRWKDSEHCFEVYAVLSIDRQFQFYVFPHNYCGLTAFSEDEVDVVDPTIGHNFQFVRMPTGHSGFVHLELLKNALFDRLVDHDPEAVNQFFSLVGDDPRSRN
jgi:hypothetical protein